MQRADKKTEFTSKRIESSPVLNIKRRRRIDASEIVKTECADKNVVQSEIKKPIKRWNG
jgi:hypothetical protein